MDDLVSVFTLRAPGIALLERPNERMSTQKHYKKRAKNAVWQVYTPTEAVCLILELEMPKKS